MSTTRVAIVATEGYSTFHLSVPLILFGETGDETSLFSRLICAEEPGLVWSKDGTAVKAEYGFEALESADIVVVPFWENIDRCPSAGLLTSLVNARQNGATLVGLCLGTFVLAHAGLLDGRRASTHWQFEAVFQQRFPQVRLDVNVLYVEDDRMITSAGTAAALDCCLYVIRQRFGAQVANHIARRMVTPPYREGGQVQYIERQVPHNTTDSRINTLLDFLQQHVHESHDIDALAQRVSMSRRTLTRHFQTSTGMSIGEWISRERIHRSQELLETTDLAIERVSEQVGFQSAVTFRQTFRQKLGVSPVEWRKTFRGTMPAD